MCLGILAVLVTRFRATKQQVMRQSTNVHLFVRTVGRRTYLHICERVELRYCLPKETSTILLSHLIKT